MPSQKSFSFWWIWLVCVTAIVMLFGMSMIGLPGLLRQLFSLLLYGTPLQMASWETGAVAYVTLMHGVLGATMAGWGTALMFLLFGPFRQGKAMGWWGVAISLIAWFIPDTFFSLWAGFWQNAGLNMVFILLYALPLAATCRSLRS